ncbi:MAG: translation initiation factor IF-3 [Puniceicoccales bacterium]|jgi:translation initiation factor IF-3|nr:translation initiation factor IF-3 [Puniceicoccales bacterium]
MAFPQQQGSGNRAPYQGANRGGRRGHFGRVQQQGPRRNERIKAPDVRVIGPDGQQIGLMSSAAALQRAREFGLDLVEIAANARPPVCRIVDYGKYQYEESKRQKKQKVATVKMKEVKLRPRCDAHDLKIKIRRAENFLFHGHKIKLILSFRFRELEHPEVGYDLIRQALADLSHIASADHQPRLLGRSMSTTLTPVSQNKRKLIHNTAPEPIEEIDDDDDDDDGGDDAPENPASSLGGAEKSTP